MATWTSQTPERTRCMDLQGYQVLKRHALGAENGNAFDFGVQPIFAAWRGDGVADMASTTIVGNTVIILEGVAGAVDGTMYAWVKDRSV